MKDEGSAIAMKKTSSLIFTGDIGFDHYMDRKWEDEDLLQKEVLAFLRSGDHLVVNVEGALSKGDNGAEASGAASLRHSIDPAAVTFLNKIGADVWNICNNHIMDAGPKGMEDTLKEAKAAGVKTLGAGSNISEASRPVFFTEAGGIGMIGVGYQRACRKADDNTPGCFSWSDLERIRETITEIKRTNRWCIVVAHAGEEFTALPTCYTRDRYHEFLEMGADVVVAHHPHVPMNYETVGKKAIFYSLGNFVFDTPYQRSQFNTESGLFIKLNFTEEDFSFDAFGIKIDREKERVVAAELPDIFVDVNEEEYRLLEPLAAKMFIENTKRQLKYLKPEKFLNATEEEFMENFYEPLRSGRVPGETLDFQIIVPIAEREKEKTWQRSTLEQVKNYILKQM